MVRQNAWAIRKRAGHPAGARTRELSKRRVSPGTSWAAVRGARFLLVDRHVVTGQANTHHCSARGKALFSNSRFSLNC